MVGGGFWMEDGGWHLPECKDNNNSKDEKMWAEEDDSDDEDE